MISLIGEIHVTKKEPRWDVHRHKDELRVGDEATIYHPEHGQLCYFEIHYNCVLYHPVKFKNRTLAQKWIDSGCIADIQEGLMILEIGFSTKSYEERNKW